MELEPDTHLIPTLLRAIATLLVWLGAPLRTWRRYVGYTDEQRFLLEKTLIAMRKRGIWLRYDGESDATVEKRLALLEAFIDSPRKAMRHLARLAMRYGKLKRRCLDGAAPDHEPQAIMLAALSAPETWPKDSS